LIGSARDWFAGNISELAWIRLLDAFASWTIVGVHDIAILAIEVAQWRAFGWRT